MIENASGNCIREESHVDGGRPLRVDGVGQPGAVHLLEHSIHSLAELASVAEVVHRSRDSMVTRVTVRANVLDADEARKTPKFGELIPLKSSRGVGAARES